MSAKSVAMSRLLAKSFAKLQLDLLIGGSSDTGYSLYKYFMLFTHFDYKNK